MRSNKKRREKGRRGRKTRTFVSQRQTHLFLWSEKFSFPSNFPLNRRRRQTRDVKINWQIQLETRARVYLCLCEWQMDVRQKQWKVFFSLFYIIICIIHPQVDSERNIKKLYKHKSFFKHREKHFGFFAPGFSFFFDLAFLIFFQHIFFSAASVVSFSRVFILWMKIPPCDLFTPDRKARRDRLMFT